jgi:zinc transport system substrate-binding protein
MTANPSTLFATTMKRINFIFIAIILSSSIACASKQPPIKVFVSIAPEAYFVAAIGGERVEAIALIKPGQSPETYTVRAEQMRALAEAKLYGSINLPFENQLVTKIKSQYPALKVVDLTTGIPMRTLCSNTHAHSHDHDHGLFDPHIWLNPDLVKIQCATLRDALIEIDPEGKSCYEDNYTKFTQQLDILSSELKEILTPAKGKALYVYHPAFGYLTDAYEIRQVAIEYEGKTPRPKYLKELTVQAQADHVRVIFVQPEFDTREAETLANAIGARVEKLDPLDYDYIKSMKLMASKIADALKEETL